jgi:filamentous hemagglutinin family protein
MIYFIKHSRALTPFRLCLISSIVLLNGTCLAQIRTDSSLGQSAQTLAGPNFLIPQSLGKLAGNNLFHSFQSFNLATGEVANFTTSSGNIANVISRVTGGDASRINGTLRLSAASGTPAFFFINPAGITFGAGASVDVPGAFHVSTANDIRFVDGRFHADLAQSSSFSTAAPEAFGFVGNSRATLAIRDGVLVKPHNPDAISVVAGDITLDSGGIGAAGGEVRAVAVGAIPVDIPLNGQIPTVEGRLQIVNDGFISTVSLGALSAGKIIVRAGDINFDFNGAISTDSFRNDRGGAGGIDVLAKNDLTMRNGGYIQSISRSFGSAADIKIAAKNITLDSDAYVYSASAIESGGNSANIALTAAEGINMKDRSNVTSYTDSTGNAGDIKFNAKNISMTGQAYIYSISDANSSGNTGNITIEARDKISIASKSKAYVSTASSGGAGSLSLKAGEIALDTGAYLFTVANGRNKNAGILTVSAEKTIMLSNNSTIQSTSTSIGNSGAIKLDAVDILLNKNSYISTFVDTSSTGSSGSIDINAKNLLSLSDLCFIDSSTFSNGQGGMIRVMAKDILIDKDSAISSLAIAGNGKAGNIEVTSSNRIVLSNSGGILANTFTDGNGGSINIKGNNINVNSRASIKTNTEDLSGHAGDIAINASGIVSMNDGIISSGTSGAGRAGSIKIDASSILLNGFDSLITADAYENSSGQTGNILLTAKDTITVNAGGKLWIINGATRFDENLVKPGTLSLSAPNIFLTGAQISAQSYSNFDAGSISVDFSKQLLLNYTNIFTQAKDGNGGSIVVKGRGIASFFGTTVNTSVLGSSGNGGDISIAADALVLTTGFIQANTAASQAKGGLVNIDVNTLVASGNTLFVGGLSTYDFTSRVFSFNVIQAAAPTGVSGVISIANPVLDLSSSLGRLNVQLLDITGLGRNPCQSTGGSSLAQSGRGGLPVSYRSSLNSESEVDSMIPGSGSGDKTSSNSTYFFGLSKACL